MKSLTQLQHELTAGTLSSRDIIDTVLARIETCNDSIGAFVDIRPEMARAAADACDDARAKGTPITPLTGIPFAVKDNLCEKNITCQCASKILQGFTPPYNATVIEKLTAAGAIPIGRVNMDEFAMGSSTEHSALQTTTNPWDTKRIPGGSSGGSAAAVASRIIPFALGSDTGGSIRQPAALCGVTGIKPTYGRVSRYGLVAFASSLDQIGVLTSSAEDAALLMNTIAGHDPHDSTSANVTVPDYNEVCSDTNACKGMKIGIPKEYFTEGLSSDVRAAVETAVKVYADAGAEIIDVSLPHTEYAVATYYIICTAEASSNLARYDGIHYGARAKDTETLDDVYTRTRGELFGKEVIRRILLGTYVLSTGYYDAYYLKALKVRTLIRNDFNRAFENVDVMITPTTPSPAFVRGEKLDDPVEMYLSDIYTVSVNLAGIPGISIPCGFSSDNLPIGMQILAPPFKEENLLKASHFYQTATDFHARMPDMCSWNDCLSSHNAL